MLYDVLWNTYEYSPDYEREDFFSHIPVDRLFREESGKHHSLHGVIFSCGCISFTDTIGDAFLGYILDRISLIENTKPQIKILDIEPFSSISSDFTKYICPSENTRMNELISESKSMTYTFLGRLKNNRPDFLPIFIDCMSKSPDNS